MSAPRRMGRRTAECCAARSADAGPRLDSRGRRYHGGARGARDAATPTGDDDDDDDDDDATSDERQRRTADGGRRATDGRRRATVRRTLVRDLHHAVERLDVVDCVERRREAGVRAENALLDGPREAKRREEMAGQSCGGTHDEGEDRSIDRRPLYHTMTVRWQSCGDTHGEGGRPAAATHRDSDENRPCNRRGFGSDALRRGERTRRAEGSQRGR